jgi:hypothetical protein
MRKEHFRKRENENREFKESRCTCRGKLPAVKISVLDAHGSRTSSGGRDRLRVHEWEGYQQREDCRDSDQWVSHRISKAVDVES